MKKIDNRQNKLVQMKAEVKHFPKVSAILSASGMPAGGETSGGISKGGAVFGLVSNLLAASKIAQAAKHCHLDIHNFDKSESLLTHAKIKPPVLVILDWDGCESESFKVLKALKADSALNHVATVGFLSSGKTPVKEEAQRAGCHRVYFKTEFMRDLEALLTRYAQ